MDAVCPIREATRDSLELWVLLNIQLKTIKARNAIAAPAQAEMGALIQTLRVTSIWLRMSPHAPKAVIKDPSTVGLKKEMPGTPL